MSKVVARTAPHDLPEPGGEALGLAAVVDLFDSIYESILTDILRGIHVSDDRERDRPGTPEVPLGKLSRCDPVAIANRSDKLCVASGEVAHLTGNAARGMC